MKTAIRKITSQSSDRSFPAVATDGIGPTPASGYVRYTVAGTGAFERVAGRESYFVDSTMEGWSLVRPIHPVVKSKIYFLLLGTLGLAGIALAIFGFAWAVVAPGTVFFAAAPVGLLLVASVGYLARLHEGDVTGQP